MGSITVEQIMKQRFASAVHARSHEALALREVLARLPGLTTVGEVRKLCTEMLMERVEGLSEADCDVCGDFPLTQEQRDGIQRALNLLGRGL